MKNKEIKVNYSTETFYITESREWFPRDIRQLCIENNYYTNGGAASYEHMLDFVLNNEPTEKNIFMVAADIVEHSDLSGYGQSEVENIQSIMFDIARACYTHFEIK